MRRVLIVSPHFAPVAAPDGQRARLLLPHLAAHGWTAQVLAVRAEDVDAPAEPGLLDTLPAGATVTRVRAWSLRWSRRFGVGNLGWRALPALFRTGSQLLRSGGFDLVYFSTTQFMCFPLGRIWRRRFGVPYVLDFQDQWRTDYRQENGGAPPGKWKYAVARGVARVLEGWAVRGCAGCVAVSPTYLTALNRRYPDPARKGSVIPFGASALDVASARRLHPASGRPAGELLVAYAGRAGPDMAGGLRALFDGFASWRKQRGQIGAARAPSVRWDFRGTSYAGNRAAASVAPVAAQAGVADAVTENPARTGYLESLAFLAQADAVLLLGSDDPAYSPSKLWPCLMLARPVLAVVPANSVLDRLLTLPDPGVYVIRVVGDSLDAFAKDNLHAWLDRLATGTLPTPVGALLSGHTAEDTARLHAELFNLIVNKNGTRPNLG